MIQDIEINFFKCQSFHKIIYKFALCLIVFTLPYHTHVNSVSIVILIVNWILIHSKHGFIKKMDQAAIFFVSFYILFLVGMIYTEDKANGWFQLEQKLSLLLFPLVLSTSYRLEKKFYDSLLILFVITCLIATLICIINAFALNYQVNKLSQIDSNLFFSHTFSGAINIHATYLSIYIDFSILIIIYFLYNVKLRTKNYLFLVLLIVYFCFCLLLLAARMEIIAIVLVAASLVLLYNNNNQITFKKIIVVSGSLLILIIFFVQNPYIKQRFYQIFDFNTLDLIGSNSENGVTQRVFIWSNCLEIIAEKPIIGSGTGDVNVELSRQYNKVLNENKDLKPSVKNAINSFISIKLNGHNEYFQTTIALGLLGLSVFIGSLFISFRKACIKRNYLFLSFIFLFGLCCLTESVLSTQKGVVFYSLFNSLLYFHFPENPLGKFLSENWEPDIPITV